MAKKKVQKGKQRGLKMNLWLKLFFMYKKPHNRQSGMLRIKFPIPLIIMSLFISNSVLFLTIYYVFRINSHKIKT